MKPGSLGRLLTLQWAGFVVALLLGFGALGLVALYVLEDSFIDRRLLAAERAMAESVQAEPSVRLLRSADLPAERRTELGALRPGALREFRLADGRYLHLRALPPDAQGPRFLAIEAQDELRVSRAMLDVAPTLLALLLLILLLAAWLARRFVQRIEGALAGLLPALEGDGDAAALRAAAAKQPVQEFRRFGTALADALDARLAALQRETDTLRFLAHELRTPLQSARLACASLAGSAEAQPARARLQRSLQRLDRASAAVLWLGEHTPAVEATEIAPLAVAMAEEFAPLAAQRGQQIESTVTAPLSWALPATAIEAVLGNLLLNALQHGGPGAIRLRIEHKAVQLDNPIDGDAAGGFGLGLELARRLLHRAGWTLETGCAQGRFVVRIEPASDAG